MEKLLELFFTPAMAIARVGGSRGPLVNFSWSQGTTERGTLANRAVPAVSLEVRPDGSIRPFLPDTICFKDEQGAIRPVAPFFELWARVESEGGQHHEIPLSPRQLKKFGATTGDLKYEIMLANLKAARRTGNAACSFVARAEIAGDDHQPRALLAISPHTADQQPLVLPDKPIPLGRLQVIRPVEKMAPSSPADLGVDRSILRLRYTPPKGYVYAPPTTINGPAPEVMPGVYEAAGIQFGRIHEIVPAERRILNPNTSWSQYVMMNGLWEDPTPQDGYDGAAVGSFRSWSCVDDSCDGTLVATLAVGGRRHRAIARIVVSPPDFAPDKRPVFSAAHDIADRELVRTRDDDTNPIVVNESNFDAIKAAVLELFHRAFEHASLFNLDAARARALQENRLRMAKPHGPIGSERPPLFADGSMTEADTGYVDKIPILAPQKPSRFTAATKNMPLPYTSAVSTVHAPLTQEAVLMDFLKRRGDFVKKMVRPPFARFRDLPLEPAIDTNTGFRDPRVFRDRLYDTRMPPYIRDTGLFPLSLTWRQYHTLLAFIDHLQASDKDKSEKGRI